MSCKQEFYKTQRGQDREQYQRLILYGVYKPLTINTLQKMRLIHVHVYIGGEFYNRSQGKKDYGINSEKCISTCMWALSEVEAPPPTHTHITILWDWDDVQISRIHSTLITCSFCNSCLDYLSWVWSMGVATKQCCIACATHISDKASIEDDDKRAHASLHDDSQLDDVWLITGTKLTHRDFLQIKENRCRSGTSTSYI